MWRKDSLMWLIVVSVVFFLNLTTCFAGIEFDFARLLKQKLGKDKRVSIAVIYDGDSGNVTTYGNLWRDKLESALSTEGLTVMPRKDLVVLIDELSLQGNNTLLERFMNIDVIVTGVYYVNEDANHVEFFLKAFDVKVGRLVLAKFYGRIFLSQDDKVKLSEVIGNVYGKHFSRNSIKQIRPGMHISEVEKALGKPEREVYGGLYSNLSAVKYGNNWIILEDFIVKCVVPVNLMKFKKVGFTVVPEDCSKIQ